MALAGVLVWLAVRAVGGGRDLTWSFAAAVWVAGYSFIEIVAAVRDKNRAAKK